MKLKHLYIKKFKNLDNFKLDFSQHDGLSLIVGNNGSGKSNLLEAISSIFANRFLRLNKRRSLKFPWDYELSYTKYDGTDVLLKSKDGRLSRAPAPSIVVKEEDILPKRVVAIYTGEESRLFHDYYEPIYKKYLRDFKYDFSQRPKMLYLDWHCWAISLLALIISDTPEDQAFVKHNLHITNIDSITFGINKSKLKAFKQGDVKTLFENISNCSSGSFSLAQFKSTLAEIGQQNKSELFLNLYIALTSKTKMFEGLVIKFNHGQDVPSLSEGEKKQLLIKAALECAGAEDSLFILDEPDAHIHLSNKSMITKILNQYSNNRSVIVTSHSPTLTQTFQNEQIVLLEKGAPIPTQDCLAASQHLCKDRNIYQLLFSKKPILLVEGKYDQDYIQNAINLLSSDKPSYSQLNFEYFVMGGTDPEIYENLLNKISKIDNNRKIIVLVDRDEAGRKVLRHLYIDAFSAPTSDERKAREDELNGYQGDIPPISIPDTNITLLLLPSVSKNQKSMLIEDFFGTKIISQYLEERLRQYKEQNLGYKDLPNDLPTNIKKYIHIHYKSFAKEDLLLFGTLLDALLNIINK